MNVFINIFDHSPCFVLKSDEDIVGIEFIDIRGKEYDMFFEKLSEFLSGLGYEWGSIRTITIVTGPGGFTVTRVITLMLSTLHITDNIALFSIDRFAYAHMLGVPFPLSLQANKAERVVAFDSHGWSLIPEVEYSDSIYHIDDDRDNFFSSENIMNFFQDCVLPLGKEEFPLKPLYIKKPHITFSNAHTAPLSLDAPL